MRDDEKANALTAVLFRTLQKHNATTMEGLGALTCALTLALVESGMPKEHAMKTISMCWDEVEVKLKNEKVSGEELQFEYLPEVKEAMAADPELREAMKDFQARMRQAAEDVRSGRFKNMDEALLAMGAKPIDLDDDD
jgi:hypothetical protein